MDAVERCRHIELSEDAALVAALAGTAMSFSHSADDQAERWLRALRLHGKVGTAMQALGVGEAPLSRTSSELTLEAPADTPPLGEEVVDRVVRRACELAAERDARVVCTTDMLFALFEIYDGLMARVLYVRGASKEELVQQLELTSAAAEPV